MGRARGRALHPGERSPAPVRSRARARRDGEARTPGHVGAARVRRRRDGLHLPRTRQRRARIRRHVAARHHVGARRPQLPHAADVGHRGSEAAVSRAAGAGREDRRLRPHRAGSGQRRARHPDDGGQEGKPLRDHRREELDLARRTSPISFLVFAWTDLEKKKQRDPVRHQRLHCRARVQGICERADEGEVGHSRGRHRLLHDGRGRGPGGESAGTSRAKGSRSRCPRSIRGASRWPPAPPD